MQLAQAVNDNLADFEPKLRDKSGILDLSDLAQVCSDDMEQIIRDCQMNVGEKNRFRTAMSLLQSNPHPTPQNINATTSGSSISITN